MLAPDMTAITLPPPPDVPPADNGRRWMTLDAASDYSQLSYPSLRRLISSGKLTAYRPLPGRVVIDRHQLDAVILASTIRPAAGRGRRKRTDGGAA